MTKSTKLFLVATLISLCLIAALPDAISTTSTRTSETGTNVLIISKYESNALTVSLGLDDRINITVFTKDQDSVGAIKNVAKPGLFNVVIMDCYLPANVNDSKYLFNLILSDNLGVLFFGGNYSTDSLTVFEPILPAYFITDKDVLNATVSESLLGMTGIDDSLFNSYLDLVYNKTLNFEILDDQVQVDVSDEEDARPDSQKFIFSENIAWQSCPLLADRVSTFAKKDNTYTIVEVPDTTKEPLIVYGNVSQFTDITGTDAQVLFISTGVASYVDEDGETQEMNTAFKLWPYFNYLMYVSVFYLDDSFDNSKIEDYATWPYSPIPHEKEATIWMIFVASLWVFNFALFFYLGKKKRNIVATSNDTTTPATPTDSVEPSLNTNAEPKMD